MHSCKVSSSVDIDTLERGLWLWGRRLFGRPFDPSVLPWSTPLTLSWLIHHLKNCFSFSVGGIRDERIGRWLTDRLVRRHFALEKRGRHRQRTGTDFFFFRFHFSWLIFSISRRLRDIWRRWSMTSTQANLSVQLVWTRWFCRGNRHYHHRIRRPTFTWSAGTYRDFIIGAKPARSERVPFALRLDSAFWLIELEHKVGLHSSGGQISGRWWFTLSLVDVGICTSAPSLIFCCCWFLCVTRVFVSFSL